MAASGRLVSVDYEVFGRVQGVFFRKYTHQTAERLGLVGWVKNADNGTVVGTVQGSEDKIQIMKDWLSKTGSPKSRIDKCEFRNEKMVSSPGFSNFSVDRGSDKPRPKKKHPGNRKPPRLK